MIWVGGEDVSPFPETFSYFPHLQTWQKWTKFFHHLPPATRVDGSTLFYGNIIPVTCLSTPERQDRPT